MKRYTTKLLVAAIAAVVAGGIALIGCGNEGFEERDQGQLSLESAGVVPLQIQQNSRFNEQTAVAFSNVGNGELTFSNFRLVDAPDRLSGILSQDDASQCEYDSGNPPMYGTGCQSGEVCWALTRTCRPLGFPETPQIIAPERSLNLDMVVLPGDEPLECPDGPSDGDENAPSNYCGKLVVETDASNDGDFIADGNATIYFTYDAGSGQIRVRPTEISFDDAEPGGTFSEDFTISNPDPEETLTINGASITKEASMFEVTGDEPIDGAQVSPQATKSWTLEFRPPAGTNLEELTGIYLEIDSSAKSGDNPAIFISIGSGGAAPVVTVEPKLVSFDTESEQTVTVTNVADENEDRPNVRLRSLTTADNSDFYTFLVDDTELQNGNIDTDLLQPGDSKVVTIRYATPDEATGSGATEARLNYSYFEGSSSTPTLANKRFALLGDQANAALGRIAPSSLLFRAADGNTKTHAFSIRNLGNAALDLSGAALGDAAVGTNDEFTFDVPASVPAGELAEGTVTFTGANSTTDNVPLNMNSNTVGTPMTLNLFADGNSPESDIEAVITPFGGDTVAVNAKVTLDAGQSTGPATSLDSAEWYLLSRPAGSSAFLGQNGRSVTFFPDAAGEYTVGMLIYESSTGSSTTYTFTAE